MKARLKTSHFSFISSINSLENKLKSRLGKNEEHQRLIRKTIAPKFAKLSLESASLKDYLLCGFPHLSKEIGRGQYGVVYRYILIYQIIEIGVSNKLLNFLFKLF